MFRSEPIIGDERIHSGGNRNVADEVAKRRSCSPVEPTTMQMKDRSALLSLSRFSPPAGYATDRIRLKGDAVRSRDVFHDSVKRTASADAFELAFHRRDCGSQSSHCGGIFSAEGMDYGPGFLDCCVLSDFGLHCFLLPMLRLYQIFNLVKTSGEPINFNRAQKVRGRICPIACRCCFSIPLEAETVRESPNAPRSFPLVCGTGRHRRMDRLHVSLSQR
jgi:hypothetical protein